jgi:hypothetical protein
MRSLLERFRVVRGEDLGDPRALAPQRHRRVRVDPFGAQSLHLVAALVDLDDAVGRVAGVNARRLLPRRFCIPLLASRCGHGQTILSERFRLSSDRAGRLGPARAD